MSTVQAEITSRLAEYLNKPPNPNLTTSLVAFYKRNNSCDAFTVYVKALGLSDPSQAKQIYNLINDNVHRLVPTAVPEIPRPEHSTRRRMLPIKYEDHDGEVPTNISQPKFKRLISTSKSHKLKPRVKLEYDDEEEEEEEEEGEDGSGRPTAPFKFKKIKHEDAVRLKDTLDDKIVKLHSTEYKTIKMEPQRFAGPNNVVVKSEPSQEESVVDSDSAFNALKQQDEEFDINIENDREWYASEEYDGAAKEDYDDADSYVSTNTNTKSRPRTNTNTYRHSNTQESGGSFDPLTGEYIDYDHSTNGGLGDLSRISLSATNFVPPFLESSKQYLQLSIGGVTVGGIGPTISPVRDSTSELAVSAKRGSFTVRDRKMKKERAKQAQDRAGVKGSRVGKENVLGVDDEGEGEGEGKDSATKAEPLTADRYTQIQLQRKSLPAFTVKQELIRTIRENQVTIVIGETGSGKTTQLAQFLYEEGLGFNKGNGNKKIIGCTQPRRMAAMSVAKRVSEEMNCEIGQEVGFSIRFEDRTDPNKTSIKYMTDGILLREILADPLLSTYSCIIMDEAHERTLSTDILLGLFRQLIKKRRDLKVIVTSATMNADKFTRFFGDAPQFTIPGRTFPVDIMYSKSSNSDHVEAAVKQILTVHLQSSTDSGDILVFMTGQDDIETTCELLQEKLDLLDNPPPLDILPIYSTLPQDLQKKIFNKSDSKRKVVVATNIAETSLTVDGIKYVIDTGLIKLKVYNPKLGMDTLQVVPVSLANANQRSGRAGRTGPGITYRLYTENATEDSRMYKQPIPEIQRTNLSNIMLLLKSLGVQDINSFPFLDSPPKDLLNCSLYDLWSINALDNFGELTPLGKQMIEFPIEPTLAKLIVQSLEFKCSEEIVTIVSMLTVPNVFYRSKERKRESDMAREKFIINESDHLTLLNIYNQWETNLKKVKNNFSSINSWCTKNFLQLKSLLRAKDIKNQLLLIMKKNRMPITRSNDDTIIRKCLCSSFYQQSAKLTKVNVNGQLEFINLRHNYMKMYLHPTSSLILNSSLSTPYVIFHELVLTSKEYMNFVTTVDPLWLLEFGYKFFDISDVKTKTKIRNEVDFKYIDKESVKQSLESDLEMFQKQQKAKADKMKQRSTTGNRIEFKRRNMGL
ncbi:P-loop containing nucleoside triphosphate hydrolase protein [Scheffersomyces amazonensis]|uniref:P-loop containing nucleoside triphosphate hydrolase protein n=1 Tax=Scheffersomyces amazonensis TaxID=1078765 RepID=UPI00315C6DF6